MMSNGNSKKQVKLKATVEGFVEPLLNRISIAKGLKEEIVNNMRILIEKTKDFFERRQNWDNELMRIFGDIERQIACCQENMGAHNEYTSSTEEQILQQNSSTEQENNERIWTELMENFNKLLDKWGVNQSIVNTTAQQEESKFFQKTTTYEVGGPSNTNDPVDDDDDAKNKLRECRNELSEQQRIWLHSLGIFPLYEKLKKKLLVHWWVGLGQVSLEGKNTIDKIRASFSKRKNKKEQMSEGTDHPNTTVEKLAENFFDYLVQKSILEPRYREHNQVINQFTIKSTIHVQLRTTFMSDDQLKARALLNVDQKYLDSKYIPSRNVFGDNNALNVVHLGRWRCTNLDNDNRVEEVASFELQNHIEVEGTDFLMKLGGNVIFLSLRGISMIDELPESIGKLRNLRILDLRACHNLAKLPYKPQSKALKLKLCEENWFSNLTHLDISECYLLNHIPKWICELSNLEVFKGYLAGCEGNESQFCQLRDLSKLKKLRKLSIRIVGPLDPKDASGLESLNCLSILTVSWSIYKYINDEDVVWNVSFPRNLEKLDIRCYPEADAAKLLNPEALLDLKRLYIRGGKIAKIANNLFWTVEILRLRFLDFLEIEWYELNRIFPRLKHMEYKWCPKLKNFTNKGSWNAEKDGQFPKCHEPTRVEMIITSNDTVPLETNQQKMMLELTGRDSITDRPRLNLVAILDVSSDMKEDNKIEQLKIAMLFVINKLSSDDSLSIVTFSNVIRTLWPLQQITEISRRELEKLVKSLSTSGSSIKDIIGGLRMGMDIFKVPEISSQNSSGIILISCGRSVNNFNDVSYVPNVAVAVHTFGIGSQHEAEVLNNIASKSMGGTYSEVKNSENLIKAVSMCLAGLLTVAVQDLTLTLRHAPFLSKIEHVSAGDYDQQFIKDFGGNYVTIKFGDLYRGEVRKVLVNLLLPAVAEEEDAKVLKVFFSYKSYGELLLQPPVDIRVRRKRTVSFDQPRVLAEESRLKTVRMINEAIYNTNALEFRKKRRMYDAKYFLEERRNNLHGQNEFLGLLSAELEGFLDMWDANSIALKSKFVHSLESSHNRQRVATRGADIEKCLSFATPAMLSFLREAEEFSVDPNPSTSLPQ